MGLNWGNVSNLRYTKIMLENKKKYATLDNQPSQGAPIWNVCQSDVSMANCAE